MTGRPWEIYTLSDPRTGGVRYVGVTAMGAQKRYRDHLSIALRGRTHCAHWVRSLIAQGLTPVLSVIEQGVGKSRVAAERDWISLYRGTCALTNLTDGGEGSLGYIPTPETRVKLSAAKKGCQVSAETRAKISAALKRRQCSPETRAKLSAANKRRKYSPKTRAKIGAANKRRIVTAETRAKMSASKRGKKYGPQSPELIAKRVLAYRAACERRNQ